MFLQIEDHEAWFNGSMRSRLYLDAEACQDFIVFCSSIIVSFNRICVS